MRGFSPSRAKLWTECSGYVQLLQDMLEQRPEPPRTDAMRQGVAAHKVAEMLFLEGSKAVKEGDIVSGVEVDEEMLKAARLYVNELPAFAKVERPIKLPELHPDMKGRVDACTVEGGRLTIWDYKYGHRGESAFENPQLLVEAAGLLREFPNITMLRLIIVQPRCYTRPVIDTWELNTVSFWADYWPKIKQAAEEAIAAPRSAKVTEGCKSCPVAGGCSQLANAVYSIMDTVEESEYKQLDNEQLAYELNALHKAKAALEARLNALETDAEGRIQEGQRIAGYEVVPALGNATWSVSAKQVIAAAAMLGHDIRKPEEALTPAQAKQNGVPEGLVRRLSTRPSRGVKLKRVNLNNVKKVFSK